MKWPITTNTLLVTATLLTGTVVFAMHNDRSETLSAAASASLPDASAYICAHQLNHYGEFSTLLRGDMECLASTVSDQRQEHGNVRSLHTSL